MTNINIAARYEREIPEGYEARIEGNKVIIELKENEDEKIRTRLIALVEAFGQGKYKNEMLSYLERQKEQKHKIVRWKPFGVCSDIPDGHYVVGRFRFGDFRLGIMCNGLFVEPNGNRAEQPKEIFYIPNADEEFIYAEQKPAEWSEEDERNFYWISTTIQERHLTPEYTKQVHKILTWLKSLRPQPHWKPSEEQLSILGKVFAGCELNTTERDSMVDLFYNLKQML